MRQQPKQRPSTLSPSSSSVSSAHARAVRDDSDNGDDNGNGDDETKSLTAAAVSSATTVSEEPALPPHGPPGASPHPSSPSSPAYSSSFTASARRAPGTRRTASASALEIEMEVEHEHDYQNDDILDSDDDQDDDEDIDDENNGDEDGVGFLYPRRYNSSSRRFDSQYSALPRQRGGGHARGSQLSSRRKLYRFLARLGVSPNLIANLPLCAGATIVGLVLVVAVLYKPATSHGGDAWAIGNHHHHGSSAVGDYSCPLNNGTAATADEVMLTHFLDRVDHLPQKERCVVRPGQRGCPCQGSSAPGMPNEATWNESWQIAHERNQQLAQNELDRADEQQRPLDVILLGDSITEAWLGTSLAQPAPKFADNYKVYQSLFRDANAPLRGLALGIAGDRCTQLLHRLHHNEIPITLKAKVFWILIGTNDFLWGSCHADEIVAGNVRVAQALLQQYPEATVVLQALLPVSTSRKIDGDAYPATQSWEYYPDINQRLDCYARSTPHVEFVNVTSLFLAPTKNEVNDTMLPDGLHPGGVAAAVWGKIIVETVQRIIQSRANQGRKR